MYAALWRLLPGPLWLRILIVVVLVAAVLAALAFWVFPWIDELTAPSQDVTVEQ
ncbi:hypothetical protein SCB71_00080 [Herbiconiux sp. KACC 21604]|uniref:hypothetical protein n=1 Tax=unclassified Herbiconiux TaxID=2618217 RepID=UPI0014909ABE|nr:hypothetical protein [Herbiconiux sp. SALV-R1]QJU55487.1 hypothetical protein HL652_18935 [Herbiconiux sp. SALV-R1]WPO86671.1 hypothetical protein SCB71_00080 [Herbiconiux sp. KACC 21604]